MKSTLLIIIILTIFGVSLVLVKIMLPNTSRTTTPTAADTNQASTQAPLPSILLTLTPDKSSVRPGDEVVILVKTPLTIPIAAVDLSLVADENQVIALEQTIGNYWTKGATLKTSAEKGIASVSGGKALGAAQSGNNTLATFTFRVADNAAGMLRFELSADSKIATTVNGKAQSIPYTIEPLEILINK